jgi:hypothetical protein
MARAVGIELRVDRGDLLLEASAAPPPVVLDLLKRHKAEIIAVLGQHASTGSPSRPPRANATLEPPASMHETDRDRGGAKHCFSTLACSIPAQAVLDGYRRRALYRLERLPVRRDDNGRRLVATTRRFLDGPWFFEALKCGWILEELFGVDANAPLDHYEQWGLVVGLALAPRHRDVIEHINSEYAVIRYRARAPAQEARRIERRFVPAPSSLVWWDCPGLVGEAE